MLMPTSEAAETRAMMRNGSMLVRLEREMRAVRRLAREVRVCVLAVVEVGGGGGGGGERGEGGEGGGGGEEGDGVLEVMIDGGSCVVCGDCGFFCFFGMLVDMVGTLMVDMVGILIWLALDSWAV